MRKLILSLVVLLAASILLLSWADLQAVKPGRRAKKARKKTGIEKRELWTNTKIVGTPDPPAPYTTEAAFPNLKFYEPLAIGLIPGSQQFVVAERPGKIYTFAIDHGVSKKNLVLDVKRVIYGVVAHPNFLENGYLYVSQQFDGAEGKKGSIRVSRFKVKNGKRPVGDVKSEVPIISWTAEGHRGGCLRFGPDGYLYISVGDGSGIADQLKTGQDLSDLLGSTLRIDVDRPAKGKSYSIPKDNPFVGRKGARPEIYSYGHRQLWKFSFDPPTGRMWGGEIGQDLWEMVYLIEKGGNYGWSVQEGTHPFRPERKMGPTEIVKPLVEHSHSDFRSITGGFVYRGNRLPELRGAYIYGDYDTGRVWSLRYENGKVIEHRELCDTQHRIVAFGQDHEGEVYLVTFASGTIFRLKTAPPPPKDAPEFPRLLSQTGLFKSTKDHVLMPGVIPYSVAAPLWSDNAIKQRFIALSGDGKIDFDGVTYPQPAPGAPPGWRFPDDSVLVKTFSLEMEAGNPKSARRLETRILHHVRMPGKDDEYGAQYWYGYTYVWNKEQTDAKLLGADGLSREYTIRDAAAPGGKRKQVWRFPSRAECTLCHTMSSKYALGPQTMQMNIDHDYDGVVANQLTTMEHLGMFSKPLPKPPSQLPSLVDYRDETQDLDTRVRSYFQANCSHCHRKWGGGNAEFQLLHTLSVADSDVLGVRPQQGIFGLKNPHLLVPGDSERSMILHRMNKIGLGRMPHIGSNVIDQQAVEMVKKWIEQMPASGK